MTDTNNTGLSRPQIEAFAAGLYYIASVDGIDEREKQAIEEFLEEAGARDFWPQLSSIQFDPERLAEALDTEWLRGVFLKSAIYLIQADGAVSPTEREALSWIANYLQVSTSLEELEAEVAKERE